MEKKASEQAMIEEFARNIPASIAKVSGSVFYSGRTAFGAPSKLYILGLNPGGSPVNQSAETIEWHMNKVLHEVPDDWSAYRDEQWGGGAGRLQRGVKHVLGQLNLELGHVPSSNVVFRRSESESTLEAHGKFSDFAAEAWAFHRVVIDRLGIRVVLCFGKTAGYWVKAQLQADENVGELVERNYRRWRTVAFRNAAGITVTIAPHPSLAAWATPACDPTALIAQMLAESE